MAWEILTIEGGCRTAMWWWLLRGWCLFVLFSLTHTIPLSLLTWNIMEYYINKSYAFDISQHHGALTTQTHHFRDCSNICWQTWTPIIAEVLCIGLLLHWFYYFVLMGEGLKATCCSYKYVGNLAEGESQGMSISKPFRLGWGSNFLKRQHVLRFSIILVFCLLSWQVPWLVIGEMIP